MRQLKGPALGGPQPSRDLNSNPFRTRSRLSTLLHLSPPLNRQDWQSWFCQNFGITPPALEPHTGQLCSCLRQCLDADHLHTCTHHSGNWQAGHELLLTAVADIAHNAGFRTNRGSRVPLSSGQRRGDLEIKGLNVAVTSDLIIDVALSRQCR